MPRKPLLSRFARTLIVLSFGYPILFAQDPPAVPAAGETLTSAQLDDLVAPIALYPDPLISQVLVAATYPLEVVQASQWLQRNPGLNGTALTEGAQQQDWDASVQALVALPDVLKRLNDDITWTTSLGNAFLAQQSDVMDAVQRMRLKAQEAGKLETTPQQTVTTTTDSGQRVVEIMPANPDVIYVPTYDPAWIWGPSIYYPYPRWYYPPRRAGVFFGFGAGVAIGGYFGGGWGGWGGWGWHPGWRNHTVIVNNTFIHRYNYNTANIRNVHGTAAWSHDASHRQGVPYANRALSDRYRTGQRENLRSGETQGQRRAASTPAAPAERMGNREIPRSAPAGNRSAFGGVERGSAARIHSDHGYSSLGPARTGGSPSRSAPEPAPRGNTGARGNTGGGRRR